MLIIKTGISAENTFGLSSTSGQSQAHKKCDFAEFFGGSKNRTNSLQYLDILTIKR